MQVPPRGAAGHGAAVAVALDHRVGTARLGIAQRPGQERALEHGVEDLAVAGEPAVLAPQPRPDRLRHRAEERRHLARHPPGEPLRRLDVDVVRTHLALLGGNRILRPRRIEQAAFKGARVTGPQQERPLHVLLEPPHGDALGPGHPDRPPLALDVEQRAAEAGHGPSPMRGVRSGRRRGARGRRRRRAPAARAPAPCWPTSRAARGRRSRAGRSPSSSPPRRARHREADRAA